MSRRLVVRPKADEDIDRRLSYYEHEADRATAARFLDAVVETFEGLRDLPEKGAPVRLRRVPLTGLRFCVVPGFPRVLVFYLVSERGIEIVRVLHGAQDARRVLRAER